MGGSTSGGYVPTVPSSPCDRINFRANINSPQPSVLSTLQVGSFLDIELQATIIVAKYHGAALGTLTGHSVANLIGCIQNGYQYHAEVLNISGGNCLVRVESI
jgi:dUTPase